MRSTCTRDGDGVMKQGSLEEREGGQPVPGNDAGQDASGLPGPCEVRQDYTDQFAAGRDQRGAGRSGVRV